MSNEFEPILLAPVTDEFYLESNDDGAIVASTAIAATTDERQVVTVDCALSPMSDHEIPNCFEFSFSIVVTNMENELPFEIQERDIAKAYIPDVSRPYIMPTVVASLAQLVSHVQPEAIYRVTKGRNLPEKALVKHELLTSVLLGMGYSLTQSATDLWGRAYWLLVR